MSLIDDLGKHTSPSTLTHYQRRAERPCSVDYNGIKNIVVICKEDDSKYIETFTGSEVGEVVEWMVWRTLGGEQKPELTVFCSPKIKTQIQTLYVEELKKLHSAIPGLIAKKKAEYEVQVQRDTEQSKVMQENLEKETYLRLKEKFGPQGLEKKIAKIIETETRGRECVCGAVEEEPCASDCVIGKLRKLL